MDGCQYMRWFLKVLNWHKSLSWQNLESSERCASGDICAIIFIVLSEMGRAAHCGCHHPLAGILGRVNDNFPPWTWAERLSSKYFIRATRKETKPVPQKNEWSNSLSHKANQWFSPGPDGQGEVEARIQAGRWAGRWAGVAPPGFLWNQQIATPETWVTWAFNEHPRMFRK